MHDCDDIEFHRLSPGSQDDFDQHAVLNHCLDEHPAQLTVSELIREFGSHQVKSVADDRIADAISSLVGAGLLHRDRDTIRPTRAALRFHRLSQRD